MGGGTLPGVPHADRWRAQDGLLLPAPAEAGSGMSDPNMTLFWWFIVVSCIFLVIGTIADAEWEQRPPHIKRRFWLKMHLVRHVVCPAIGHKWDDIASGFLGVCDRCYGDWPHTCDRCLTSVRWLKGKWVSAYEETHCYHGGIHTCD